MTFIGGLSDVQLDESVNPQVTKDFEMEYLRKLRRMGRDGMFSKISSIPNLEHNIVMIMCAEGAEAKHVLVEMDKRVEEAKKLHRRHDRVICHPLTNHGGGFMMAPTDVIEEMVSKFAAEEAAEAQHYLFKMLKNAIAFKYIPTILLVGHGGETACSMARLLKVTLDRQFVLIMDAMRHVDRVMNSWLAECRANPDAHPCLEEKHFGHSWLEHFKFPALNVEGAYNINDHEIRRLRRLNLMSAIEAQDFMAELNEGTPRLSELRARTAAPSMS